MHPFRAIHRVLLGANKLSPVCHLLKRFGLKFAKLSESAVDSDALLLDCKLRLGQRFNRCMKGALLLFDFDQVMGLVMPHHTLQFNRAHLFLCLSRPLVVSRQGINVAVSG